MKTKIAYVAASVVALTVPVLTLTAPMAGCGGGSSPGVSVSTGDGGTGPSVDGGGGGGDAVAPQNDAALPDAPSGTKLVPLTATNTGYVSPTNPVVGTTVPNTVGVTGAWYAYGDGWGTEGVGGAAGVAGERGNCELIGGFPVSACSTITSPLPAAPMAADDGGATTDDSGTPHAPGDEAGAEAGAAEAGADATAEAAAGDATAGDATAVSDATGADATGTADGSAEAASGDDGGMTVPAGYANGFPPTPADSQTFCLSGVAAAVINGDGGTPDYSDIYGIGMGFDFNNMGGVKAAYNAAANKVIGVFFHITSAGAFPSLRVEFPTVGTNGAGGGDSYIVSPTANGDVTVIFAKDLATPYPPVSGMNIGYAAPAGDTIPMFDPEGGVAPTDLLSIQFHIPTATGGTVTVNQLCVSNLSAIVSTM